MYVDMEKELTNVHYSHRLGSVWAKRYKVAREMYGGLACRPAVTHLNTVKVLLEIYQHTTHSMEERDISHIYAPRGVKSDSSKRNSQHR